MMPRSKLGVFLCCLAPLSFAATKAPAWFQDVAHVARPASAGKACRQSSKDAARLGTKVQEGFEGWVSLMVLDYKLVNRSFYIQVPTGLNRPAPLLIALHAQGFEADSYAKAHDFGSFGQSLGFVSIYPQGLDDALPGGADLGTGWNVGTAGDNQTCIGDEVMADCYESCWEQNKCGRCNWSGCYDERLFIFSVI